MSVFVHAGAGYHARRHRKELERVMRRAAQVGLATLRVRSPARKRPADGVTITLTPPLATRLRERRPSDEAAFRPTRPRLRPTHTLSRQASGSPALAAERAVGVMEESSRCNAGFGANLNAVRDSSASDPDGSAMDP